MALQLADRVQQTGTANTTVSFTLSGSLSGYQPFSSAITTGNTLYYAATDGTNWEVGVGTLTNSTTLTRNNCLSSSNSNALVSTFSGTVSIWVDYPSSKAVYQDASNNVTLPAQLTAANYVANETITGSLYAGAFSYGTLGYPDVNIFESFTSSVNTYNQCIIQNTNNGNAASTDYVVSNNNGSSTAYYGDFGMNSSGWAGTAGTNSFNAPNMVYLTSTTGDLLLGTTTSNAIRFATNGGADAAQISSAGLFSTTSDATIHTLTVGLGGGSQTNSTAFGFQALNATNTGQNTAIGYTAGKAILSGGSNVFVGQYSGTTLTTANYNTGIGHGALNASNADKNTGIGFQALTSITSGQSNTAVGYGANQSNTIGQQNVVVGNNAMFAGVTGSTNVAVGNQAMQQSTGVNGMVAVGNGALISTTTTLNTGTTNVGTITPGSGYVAGTYTAVALSKIATGGGTSVINAGSYGTATVVVNADGTVHAGGVTIVNPGSGYVDTTTVLTVSNTLLGGSGSGFQFTLTGSLLSASANVGIGNGAISTNSTGSSITAVGYQAGTNATTGSNNVFVGTNAGSSSVATTTGFQLVYIGSGAHGSAATNQNEIVIGYNAVGLGNNTTVIGTSGTTALTQVYGTLNTSGYTFSTLPSTAATGKVTGARTYVTDATTLSAGVFGGAVAGGGSVTIPVFYNGTTWIVG